MTQWDFAADIEELVASVEAGGGPRSMSSMVQTAAALAERSRREDPAGLHRWFDDNAAALIGQQLLIANVHAQESAEIDLPSAVRRWAAQYEGRTPSEALAWLKEEHPGLLRAWLLSRAEGLIGEELARGQAASDPAQ